MKKSELLTDSMRYLHCMFYVCHAIEFSGYRLNQTKVAKEILKDIAKLIYPYNKVFTWIQKETDALEEHLTRDNLYAYRKRWVKHMIKQYKVKGD